MRETDHHIGDDCPGGHADQLAAQLRPAPGPDLARVDIAAVAKRLTQPQRRVLAEVPAGLLRRDELAARRISYVVTWHRPVATATVRALLRNELIERGDREPDRRYSIYRLTDLGRAVLDHLAEVKS